MIIFAAAFCHPVQSQADQREDNRSDCQADHRSPDAALLIGVFEHFKGECRDQGTSGKRKHGRKRAFRKLNAGTDQRTQYQGA